MAEAEKSFRLRLIDGMMTGAGHWIEAGAAIHTAGGVLGGLDKGGLIAIIIISIIAIVSFVWIFRETGKRD